MSEADFDSFNDPALRSAVRRVWGDEQAPAELREKLQELFPKPRRANAGSPLREPIVLRLRSALYGLVAAAVFFLAVGLAFQDWVTGQRHSHIAPRVLMLPSPVADDLVSQHEAMIKKSGPAGGALALADDQFQLESRLGFPVLAMDVRGTEWKFRGVAVPAIHGGKSGQLLFDAGGKKFISVFSMPPSTVNGAAPACEYAQVVGSHPLAGFASNKALYCLVASSTDGSLTLDDIRAIRDTLRPTNGGSATVAVVILP